ncbi:hypothetical protein ABIA33_004530 [Streptacidiphilus sp. MAP12-16]
MRCGRAERCRSVTSVRCRVYRESQERGVSPVNVTFVTAALGSNPADLSHLPAAD